MEQVMALQQMQQMDIMALKREELADIKDIQIDESKSITNRVKSYYEQAGNPFAKRVDDYILMVGYANDSQKEISDCMVAYVNRLVKIKA